MSKKQTVNTKPAETALELTPITAEAETQVPASIPQGEVTPMVMMQMAISQNADMETMERLWALNEKVEAANAKKAYVSAMAQFKKDAPLIEKDRTVSYENNDGSQTTYDHASLGNVVDKITEGLADYGFSHKWDVEQLEGGQVKVTCVITHEQGHSESVGLSNSRDDSGSKNNLQSLASTITYLERYTLLAATGSATQDQDDDGQASETAINVEAISEEQSNELHALIDENNLKMDKFIQWMKADFGCETFAAIPVTHFERTKNRIKSAIRAQANNQEKKDNE